MGGSEVESKGAAAREVARRVLEIESRAVASLADRLDESFDRAVDLVCDATIIRREQGGGAVRFGQTRLVVKEKEWNASGSCIYTSRSTFTTV